MEAGSIFLRPAVMVGGAVFERERDDPFVYQLHKHEYISEMFFVDEGAGLFNIDGVAYEAEAGTLLLYQRGVWHEERSTAHPFRGMYVGFKGLELRGAPADFFLPPERAPVIRLEEHAAAFSRSLRECIEEFWRNEPESRAIASHLLGVLMSRLARLVHYPESPQVQKPSQTVVLRARQFIEENYYQAITLETLSQLTYVNEYYLAHLFKADMGVSPIQYLIQCRMDAAKRYLTMSDYAVRRIAGLVGYQSETTFHAVFKKATGVTPLQYRKLRGERE